MSEGLGLFIGLVFLAVFVLIVGLFMPVFGENRQSNKRLRQRLKNLAKETEVPEAIKLLRENTLNNLSGWERQLEESEALADLKLMIAQSGRKLLVYRFLLFSLAIALAAGVVVFILTKLWLLALGALLVGGLAPYLKIRHERQQRLALFEEQLPEAIDIMRRALQAGHPFNESLHLVEEELEDPIKTEFSITFSELNYGNNVKWALLGLLGRVQSVNVMALVTSVLVQMETGGNLAEILSNLSRVIRARFRFHRKVRTLSAEGRMSAWILVLVPFFLFGLIHFTTPGYLPILMESETGKKMIVGSFLGMIVGVFWIRRIIRIDV